MLALAVIPHTTHRAYIDRTTRAHTDKNGKNTGRQPTIAVPVPTTTQANPSAVRPRLTIHSQRQIASLFPHRPTGIQLPQVPVKSNL